MDNPYVSPENPGGDVPPAGDGAPLNETNPEARNWGMFCHLATFAGYVIPIPFANIIAPLIIWQMKKEQFPFVDYCGKESINFNITLLIAALISGALICVVVGAVLLPVVLVYGIVMPIIA